MNVGAVSDLDAALEEAVNRYVASNPQSRLLFDRAKKSMPGGNTRSVLAYDPFPLYIARSGGARVTDVDGNSYLDVLGEYSAGLYGHSDPIIRAAMIDAIDAGSVNGGPIEAEIRLAETICARFQSIERVRFCNSATEANLYALSLARHVLARPNVICFNGSYHGGFMAFGPIPGPMNVPLDWVMCRYNDIEGTRIAVRRNAALLAAVIVEPMMSNGGSIPATREFLQMLRDETRTAGAALIFDEVVTSRMGAGGLQGRLNIMPDITTLGKYLGGGFSAGAFGGSAEWMDHFDYSRPGALSHAGTFNNNIFSMTAGAAGLDRVFTPERAESLFDRGERLRYELNTITSAFDVPMQFTGCGSIMNVHFTQTPITCPEDIHDNTGLLKLFHLDLIERGIYAARRGLITTSLTMTEDDLHQLTTAIAAIIEDRAKLIRATKSYRP